MDKGKIHLTLNTIPKEYQHHTKVFSEEESQCFPPERSKDMMIKLSPNAARTLRINIIYTSQKAILQPWGLPCHVY